MPRPAYRIWHADQPPQPLLAVLAHYMNFYRNSSNSAWCFARLASNSASIAVFSLVQCLLLRNPTISPATATEQPSPLPFRFSCPVFLFQYPPIHYANSVSCASFTSSNDLQCASRDSCSSFSCCSRSLSQFFLLLSVLLTDLLSLIITIPLFVWLTAAVLSPLLDFLYFRTARLSLTPFILAVQTCFHI